MTSLTKLKASSRALRQSPGRTEVQGSLRENEGGEPVSDFESMSQDDREAYVAQCLGCDPSGKESWPMQAIRRLINVRLEEGEPRFALEVRKMMLP